MDIAKMLNTTILACLLILTGCLGLGATDDDVIDDAEGEDTGTTVVNTYPPVNSLTGNGTIVAFEGEYVEILNIYYSGITDGSSWIGHWPTASIEVDCQHPNYHGLQGTMSHNLATYNHNYLPSDGGICSYDFTSPSSSSGNNYTLNVIYRVWS